MIAGASRGRKSASWYEDLVGKFSRQTPDCLNVACVTTCLEPDEDLKQRARELLSTGEPIDAVVVWSNYCPNDKRLMVIAEDGVAQLLEQMLAPIPREDSEIVILQTHLMRKTRRSREW